MRLKPAPNLQGWNSNEERKQYDRNRWLGRTIFVNVVVVAAWVLAPVAFIREVSDADLENALRAKASEVFAENYTQECSEAPAVDKASAARVAASRSEHARFAYKAAIWGNDMNGNWSESPSRSIIQRCPSETQRVVTELNRLGKTMAQELARDIRTGSLAMIEGILSQSEAAEAKRAGLICALASLSTRTSIEGASSTFRVLIPARPTSWRQRLREALLGPLAEQDTVALRLARDKLAAIAAFAERKVEPVAQAIFDGYALVETTLAVTIPYARTDVAHSLDYPEGDILTAYVVLHDVDLVSSVAPGVPDKCARGGFSAGGTILNRMVSNRLDDEAPSQRVHLTLALRISYMDRTAVGQRPSSIYTYDKDRIARYTAE